MAFLDAALGRASSFLLVVLTKIVFRMCTALGPEMRTMPTEQLGPPDTIAAMVSWASDASSMGAEEPGPMDASRSKPALLLGKASVENSFGEDEAGRSVPQRKLPVEATMHLLRHRGAALPPAPRSRASQDLISFNHGRAMFSPLLPRFFNPGSGSHSSTIFGIR